MKALENEMLEKNLQILKTKKDFCNFFGIRDYFATKGCLFEGNF